MDEIQELPPLIEVPMDDHYWFQCSGCGEVSAIHYYTYEAMMDYDEEVAV